MTNEELALSIQSGNTALYPQLWEQVQHLIATKAYNYYCRFEGPCTRSGVTLDDLIQSGFFAMLDAVKAYDPESGYTFNAYLNYPLCNTWNSMTGRRQRVPDTLNQCTSLDAPVCSDGEECDLNGLIPDPTAIEDMDRVIDHAFQGELSQALTEALEKIDEKPRHVIRSRYFEGKTLQEIGEQMGVNRSRVQQFETKGMNQLRHSRIRRSLESFREEIISRHAWYGTGLNAFRSNQASSPERAVERADMIVESTLVRGTFLTL